MYLCLQAAHCYIHIAALLAEYLKRRGMSLFGVVFIVVLQSFEADIDK